MTKVVGVFCTNITCTYTCFSYYRQWNDHVMCTVLHYMAYTCIKHIKHPLSVSDEVNFFIPCLPLPSILPWSHLSISSELKKKKKRKKKEERVLKRALSITSWAFLVCWSLSKQAIVSFYLPLSKVFYVWWDRNDNSFQEIQGVKGALRVGGKRHPLSNNATPFLSEKWIFDLKAGLNDAWN